MTNSTSTSDIYLKKSELPQNVSAFKNDAQYISSTSLDNWLKTHSYLSKEEAVALINDANLIITDKINDTFDESAVGRLDILISAMQGEITELKEKFNQMKQETNDKFASLDEDGDEQNYIPAEKESTFAKKTDFEALDDRLSSVEASLSNESDVPTTTPSEPVDLSAYATKEWVGEQGYFRSDMGLASKTWVKEQGYAETSDIPSLDGYATKDWVESRGYLTEHQNLDAYATEEWVEGRGYLKNHQSLDGYATEDWVESRGYLKSHQSLKNYATKDWVEGKGYLTEHQSLKGLATEEWVASQGYANSSRISSMLKGYAKADNVYTKSAAEARFLTPSEANAQYETKEDLQSNYLTKKDVQSNYLTKKDATNTYLTKEDYRGLKSAATISNAYASKHLDDILNDLNKGYTLLDGFYITRDGEDHQMFVLIKNNELQITEGGNVALLQWIEED